MACLPTIMISPYSHEKAQEEAIAEALSELMMSGDDASEAAYCSILKAIDGWLVYHSEEKIKWEMLREKVSGVSQADR